jgi:hypothetical protein
VTDLERLRELGEELRALFADERRAIAELDHARLTYLAEQKQRVATALGELHGAMTMTNAPELKLLLEAVRVEARANAMLAATAGEAVRALLGYEPAAGYNRRAKPITNHPLRLIASY